MANVLIRREGPNLVVSFSYHPDLVGKIKGLPNRARRWDPKRKAWLVALSEYQGLLKALEGHSVLTDPPDLLEKIEEELHPGLRMKCFICGTRIRCEECQFSDGCQVKDAIANCLCLSCLDSEEGYLAYKMAFLKALEGIG